MSLRSTVFPLLLSVLAVACNFPDAAQAPDPTPTTVQSVPSDTPEPPAPTDAPTPVPTSTQAPPPELLRVAYVEAGDAWAIELGGTPAQLTVSGEVSDVRLSDDGQLVIYSVLDSFTGTFELRAIGFDGTGDRPLVDAATLDGLYPLDGFLHTTISQVEFVPGSHVVLFNTRRVLEGPGLVKNDDLISVNADDGSLAPLLAPGSGGDFAFSNAGGELVLVRPDSVSFADLDGSNLRSAVLSYTPIITYSEYLYYPFPLWTPDDESVIMAIPGEDPFVAAPAGLIHEVPSSGAAPSVIASISGDLFVPQREVPLVSPDGNNVAFLRPVELPGEKELVILNFISSELVVYDTGLLFWKGWGPDSIHFFYTSGDGLSLVKGAIGYEPEPIEQGSFLRWVDAESYLYAAGALKAWTLTLGALHADPQPLVLLSGIRATYDFAD